jgi:nucleotide-binding universal stress UspA family protein
MKILCPTDMSEAANYGVEYAANLCKALNAELSLMYVQNIELNEGVSMFSGSQIPAVKHATEKGKRLEQECIDISLKFGIPCKYVSEYSFSSFTTQVAHESLNYDLLVSGTNGTETLFQFYTGSNSYKLAKKTDCPVLIIPEGCNYKDIKKAVFASGADYMEHIHLNQLQKFISILRPELHLIHISDEDDAVNREVYAAYRKEAEEVLKYDGPTNFERIVDSDEVHGILNYVNMEKADLLIVCMEKHNSLYRFFNSGFVKKITAYDSGFPIMIVHN